MNLQVSIATATRVPGESATRVPLNYPSLRASDIRMITAATGVEFKWPPAMGEVFPAVASDLASARWRASLAGQDWGDLTTKDLHALRRQGIIDSEFLDKALNHLSGKDATPRNTLAPAAVSVTADGNVTLDGYV